MMRFGTIRLSLADRPVNKVGAINLSTKVLWVAILTLLCLCASAMPLLAASNKIVFMGYTINFGPELQEAFDLFTKRTGIAIETVPVTTWADLNQKLITMTAAGVAPDVVYGDDIRIFAFAETGLLEPIDAYITRDNLNMRLYPIPVVEGLKVRNRLYSLPTAVSIHGTFYNVDLFDKYGLPYLPTDWSTTTFTWDDFTMLVRKLTVDTNGDGQTDQFGLQDFGTYGGWNMLGLWNVTDIDANRTQYKGDDPAVFNAMLKIMSLHTEYKAWGGNFLNQTAGTTTTQSYYVNNLRTQMVNGNLINWKLGVLPKGDTRVSQGAFLSLGIPSGSINKEAAWALVRFLAYEPEGAMLFTRAENRTPLLRETTRDYLQRWEALLPGCNLQVLTDATQVIWKWDLASGAGATDILQILNTTWAQIKADRISPAVAITNNKPLIQAILDKNH
jgi:ABC-type glycerol-3-phosphate transport system substrate-binding protein